MLYEVITLSTLPPGTSLATDLAKLPVKEGLQPLGEHLQVRGLPQIIHDDIAAFSVDIRRQETELRLFADRDDHHVRVKSYNFV